MLIRDKEPSVEQGHDMDDENGQYGENKETEDNQPGETWQKPDETFQEDGNNLNSQDDKSTHMETDQDEDEYEGQFDYEDYEYVVFLQKDILCNVQ